MKNDKKIKRTMEEIKSCVDEWLDAPNQCAYTDSILALVIEKAMRLKELDDTNEPD